jgi:hypothetical protein
MTRMLDNLRKQMQEKLLLRYAGNCIVIEEEWNDCCLCCRFCRANGDDFECIHNAPLLMTERRAWRRRHCQYWEEA